MKNFKTMFSVAILTFFLVSTGFSQSAIGSFGNTYLKEDAKVGLHNNLVFNNSGTGIYSGIISTNRSANNPGVVVFANNASWENANDFQHVDGYVEVLSDDAFVFPIGNLGLFKPVSISGAKGTLAAYFMDNPSKLPFINTAISSRSIATTSELVIKVSDKEYWDIQGDVSTEITLYWDINSDINELCNDDLSNLKIAGWNGSSWEIISSSVDDNVLSIASSSVNYTKSRTTVHNGSITTDVKVTPNDYEVFTFAILTDKANVNNNVDYDSQLIDNENIQFTLFPNPTFDIGNVNIDYDLSGVSSKAYLEIYNVTGERLYVAPISGKDIIRIPFNESTAGMYHIGVTTEKGSKVFKPVMISSR